MGLGGDFGVGVGGEKRDGDVRFALGDTFAGTVVVTEGAVKDVGPGHVREGVKGTWDHEEKEETEVEEEEEEKEEAEVEEEAEEAEEAAEEIVLSEDEKELVRILLALSVECASAGACACEQMRVHWLTDADMQADRQIDR